MLDERLVLWFISLVGCAGALVLVLRLAPGARLRRRRRKSHGRIVSKGNRPMVRFSVRPPKE